jgi:hypothetical protein
MFLQKLCAVNYCNALIVGLAGQLQLVSQVLQVTQVRLGFYKLKQAREKLNLSDVISGTDWESVLIIFCAFSYLLYTTITCLA